MESCYHRNRNCLNTIISIGGIVMASGIMQVFNVGELNKSEDFSFYLYLDII